MSLAAQIRLDPSNRLLIGLMLIAAGGFGLSFAAILARFHSGLPIGILTGLVIGMLLLALIAARRCLGQPGRIALHFRILEDGSIELADGLEKGNADKTAGMQNQVSRYQLAPGSLIWPELFILRLQPLNSPLDIDAKNTSTVSIVIFKSVLSEQNRRALARWLIWAQHKTQGKTVRSFLPPQSPAN